MAGLLDVHQLCGNAAALGEGPHRRQGAVGAAWVETRGGAQQIHEHPGVEEPLLDGSGHTERRHRSAHAAPGLCAHGAGAASATWSRSRKARYIPTLNALTRSG